MTSYLRYIIVLIVVLFIGNGSLWGQTFDPDDCPRGPLVRVPITSLTKATSADFMVLTDSCGNQYYTHKDSVTTKGGIINQYFAGDTLITIALGDTFITIINIQGDTSGTGRFRLYDNLGEQDTITTWLPGTPTDNLNVTNGLSIDAATNPRLKLGGRLIENTTITGQNNTWNLRFDSLNLEQHFANSHRFYPKQSFILQHDNSPTAYVQLTSPTSMYIRGDTTIHLDAYNHGLSDTSHLLIRTDRARDGSWVKGGFLQLLRTSAGIHQGECDWSLYALPEAIPDSSGNYVLAYDSGSKTFDWAEETGGGGGGVGGSGTLNYVAKWTPDGNTLGNSQIFDDGTRIGIGSSGYVDSAGGVTIGDGSPPHVVFKGDSGGFVQYFQNSSNVKMNYIRSSNSNEFQIYSYKTGNAGTKLHMDGDGKTALGNNVSSAGARLDVIGSDITVPALKVTGPGTGSEKIFSIFNSAATNTFYQTGNGYAQFNPSNTTAVVQNYHTTLGSGTTSNYMLYSFSPNEGYLKKTADDKWLLSTITGTFKLTIDSLLRVSGSIDTATLANLWAGNTAGDLRKITLGSGLSFSGGTLVADPTSLQYWTESLATFDTSTVWRPKTGTNVTAVISPRGTGAFIAGPAPDGTAVGGNARGDHAIDLQLTRTAATQVASGNRAVAIGYRATSSGQDAVAVGSLVTASAGRNVAIGYNVAATSASDAAVSIGHSSQAYAAGSATIGLYNKAYAYGSMATGTYSRALLYGQRSHAAYRFATEGDNQTSDLRAWITVVGTTGKYLAVDGNAAKAVLTVGSGNPNSRVWNARIQVVASTTDTGNGSGSFGDTFIGNYEVGIKNILGTTSLVGSGVITNSIAADAGMAGASVTITANDTDDSLDILFTPPTSAGSTTETYVTATIYLTEMAY